MMNPATPSLLRVMTVNVHKGFTFFNRRFVLRELRDAVREVGSDLVFLQEIHGARIGLSTGLDMPHYEFLADEIWPAFAYGRNAVYTDGDHGNALLSKYPIEQYENVDVSAPSQEKRGLLYCALRLPGRIAPLHTLCVHLGLTQRHRSRQLQQLCEFIEQRVPRAEPLLVAGDFNDWRGKAHRLLWRCAGLAEVFVHSRGRAERTFPAPIPLLRLDRIYARGVCEHLPLALPARPWSSLSDHAPLAAEIRL
jgi:endonuclease/exonuclease/phosphatase family metal-dependent hydrolase